MEKILRELVEQRKTIKEISELIGKSPTTVIYWLKKFGLKTNANLSEIMKRVAKNRKINNGRPAFDLDTIDWKEVQNHYDNGGTCRTIQKKWGIYSCHIVKAKKLGLFHPRNNKDVAGRHPCSDNAKKLLSEYRKDLYKNHPEKHPNRLVANNREKMTYPEKIVFDLLSFKKIKFEHNSKIGNYWVDFRIGNIAIEVDGKRWHNVERDKKRDAVIKKFGVNVYRFDSQEVVKNPEIILTVI